MVKTIDIGGLQESLPIEYAKYEDTFTTAGEAMKDALEILNEPDFDDRTSWKADCHSEEVNVHYKDKPEGRYMACKCKVPLSAKDMAAEFWDRIEYQQEWNEHLRLTKRIRKLTDNVDLIHSITNDVLFIKSREVVAARMRREINGSIIIAIRSITLPDEIPESSTSVRAHVHLSLARFTPDPEDPEHACVYDNIGCSDMKGYLFKSAVNQVMGRILLKGIGLLRKQVIEVIRPKLYSLQVESLTA